MRPVFHTEFDRVGFEIAFFLADQVFSFGNAVFVPFAAGATGTRADHGQG